MGVSIRMARYQVCQILLLSFLASSLACPDVCPQVKLTSEGGFAHDYPHFLGTWVYSGEWDGNPWFFCSDCQGLRAYVLFLRDDDNSNQGHWTVTDCHPDDIACGGGAHRLLISPRTNCLQSCIHELSKTGWYYCDGELSSNGICSSCQPDNTVEFKCEL